LAKEKAIAYAHYQEVIKAAYAKEEADRLAAKAKADAIASQPKQELTQPKNKPRNKGEANEQGTIPLQLLQAGVGGLVALGGGDFWEGYNLGTQLTNLTTGTPSRDPANEVQDYVPIDQEAALSVLQ